MRFFPLLSPHSLPTPIPYLSSSISSFSIFIVLSWLNIYYLRSSLPNMPWNRLLYMTLVMNFSLFSWQIHSPLSQFLILCCVKVRQKEHDWLRCPNNLTKWPKVWIFVFTCCFLRDIGNTHSKVPEPTAGKVKTISYSSNNSYRIYLEASCSRFMRQK